MQAIALINNKGENLNIDSKKIDNSKNVNIDFLELLLKNVNIKKSENSKEIKNFIKDDEKNILNNSNNIKELQELLKALLLENKTPQNIKISDVINKLNVDKNIIKEVKNIITSNLKQQNILLTKVEIQNFKKIDNVKDLLKFANKKGLNIEKITFQIAKDIKQSSKLQKNIIKDIKTFKKAELSQFQPTTQILSTKRSVKITNIGNKNNKNSNEKISLETIMKKNINKIDKKIDKSEVKNNSQKSIKNSDKEAIVQKEKNESHNIKENHTNNNNKIQKNDKSSIDLNSLLKIKDNNGNKRGKEENIIKITKHNINKENKVSIQRENSENEKEINLNLQNQNININEIKAKQVIAKETINHFKNNLDEAIKNYKPPVSKVNIELNPKNLGKVEVTIIQRGNNIQVNMHTDQSNVILFQNHQAEFRQALTNIGFSNIDMNFNSNQEKERKQQQAKKSYKDNEDNEIGEIEIKADYKYA